MLGQERPELLGVRLIGLWVRDPRTGEFQEVLGRAGREDDERNGTAKPRPAIGFASDVFGLPLAFENRIVVFTGSPCRCAARENFAASGVAVKVPVQNVPLACTARWPG